MQHCPQRVWVGPCQCGCHAQRPQRSNKEMQGLGALDVATCSSLPSIYSKIVQPTWSGPTMAIFVLLAASNSLRTSCLLKGLPLYRGAPSPLAFTPVVKSTCVCPTAVRAATFQSLCVAGVHGAARPCTICTPRHLPRSRAGTTAPGGRLCTASLARPCSTMHTSHT